MPVIPFPVTELLRAPESDLVMPTGTVTCPCSGSHQPAPLTLQGHYLADGTLTWMCPTAHANVHAIMDVFVGGQAVSEAKVRAVFPVPVSRYAYKVAVASSETAPTR